jgi:ribosome maturation factor RimP
LRKETPVPGARTETGVGQRPAPVVSPRPEDRLVDALAPLVSSLGAELIDVEFPPGVVRLYVDSLEALDLERLGEISRVVSSELDSRPEIAPAGRYELEVSSPGVERRLRRPEHFLRVKGARLALRTVPGADGDRRAEGVLCDCDAEGIVVASDDGTERRFAYAEIERAHTVFDWRAALSESKQRARQVGHR